MTNCKFCGPNGFRLLPRLRTHCDAPCLWHRLRRWNNCVTILDIIFFFITLHNYGVTQQKINPWQSCHRRSLCAVTLRGGGAESLVALPRRHPPDDTHHRHGHHHLNTQQHACRDGGAVDACGNHFGLHHRLVVVAAADSVDG